MWGGLFLGVSHALLGQDPSTTNFGGSFLFMLTPFREQFSVAVTRWFRSTQLLYIEPG